MKVQFNCSEKKKKYKNDETNNKEIAHSFFPDRLREREKKTKLPDNYDITGAAFGIARLHSLYHLNATEMVENGIVTSEHGKTKLNARSDPSVLKLSGNKLTSLKSLPILGWPA